MTVALLGAALVAFGLLTGVTAGALGVGGGVMIVPFLTLALGMTQHEAEGTSLLVIVPTAIVASVVLHRRSVGELGNALRLGVLGALGSAAGALAALALPGDALRVVFAVFLAGVGVRLVRDGLREPAAE